MLCQFQVYSKVIQCVFNKNFNQHKAKSVSNLGSSSRPPADGDVQFFALSLDGLLLAPVTLLHL